MRSDKERSPNGIVLLTLNVKEVFVHVVRIWARCAKSLLARKSQCCKVVREGVELQEGGGCSIFS